MQNEALISDATKHNWLRLNIKESEIKNRLSKRANKTCSLKKIIPVEYFVNRQNKIVLEKIIKNSYDIASTIFTLAINLLLRCKIVKIEKNQITSQNPYILEILEEFNSISTIPEFLEIKLPTERDFLGIVYQSLLSEGCKNKKGSYYTPHFITDKYLSKLSPNMTVFDPCCGTGSFLLSAAKIIENPKNIYGCDLDPIACFIAKINLIIQYKNIEFKPNIFNLDFLEDYYLEQKFDVIATNPPWGAYGAKKYKKAFPDILSGESFSYFIHKSADYLNSNGSMYFVLPESILNVKTHQDIRKFILNNFHINSIDLIGRAFSGVLSSVIVINLDKNCANSKIKIKTQKSCMCLSQDYYRENTNNNFSILDNKDVEILKKIYSLKHIHLDDRSKWAIGIVTGNNSKYVSQDRNSGEMIFSGRNIHKAKITSTDKYLKYDRKNFQQVASDNIYRAKEKLVYKFISKKLVFALDNEKRLFLNSANILIPKLKGYSVKTVMVFLNSKLFQYIYTKKFNEIKILKGNLMKLPFPIKVPNIENLNDENIFELYNLTPKEISYIKKELSYL